ncbi:uncharacterized protein LOC111699416 [Eurytemora carolleeae]|uniref:uncharacterized protein LOC111699416 n=1 Tax=Eurytemora carolleeae TaxID=1294199 RepID=UPI000C76D863|nr:uncharacterized protein LOC111699416 [Eurytemora carolleeae]|eukprot:XP_023325859.1 uncharacterized protein LOC111699416 [Eurytemora affinis]
MFEATVLSSSEDENEEVYHLETEVITVRVPGVAMKSGKKCKSQFVITAQTLLPHDAARLPEGEVIVAKEDRNFYVGNKRVEVLKRIPAEVFALDDQIVPAVPAQDQVIEATEPMNDEKAADVHVQEERRLPESEKEKKEDHSDIVGLFREQFPIAEQIFQHDEDSKQLMINNAKVQENNIKVFKRTKQAIVDRAIVEVHRLWTYNTTSLPTQRFWSAILKVLECIYPNMFQIDGVILLEGGQIFCPPIVKKANLPVMMYRKGN